MFGHKLFYNSSNRFGHKNTVGNKFSHKAQTSKNNNHTLLDDNDNDKVPKSDLERHSTREYHSYHSSHNPSHR
jgi:hypothetical protein